MEICCGDDLPITRVTLKYFCKSLVEEEREVLEKNIFKSKKDVNKKVIVVFSENYKNIASFLKNKYPEEEYFMMQMI